MAYVSVKLPDRHWFDFEDHAGRLIRGGQTGDIYLVTEGGKDRLNARKHYHFFLCLNTSKLWNDLGVENNHFEFLPEMTEVLFKQERRHE